MLLNIQKTNCHRTLRVLIVIDNFFKEAHTERNFVTIFIILIFIIDIVDYDLGKSSKYKNYC